MPDEIDIDLEASDRALDRLAAEAPLTPAASAAALGRLKELRRPLKPYRVFHGENTDVPAP